MRGRGEQDEVALRVFGQALQQLEAQLLAGAAADACVGLVHHDALGSGGDELLAVTFALDVVEAHDDHRVVIKQAQTVGQLTFDASCGGCGERDGLKVEALFQLGLPLLHQVRRAEHGQARDLASIHQLAGDQPGFDRLADTNIVCDQ